MSRKENVWSSVFFATHYTLLKTDNNNYAYSIHDFAQKRSKRSAKLERPNILLLPVTFPAKIPDSICFAKSYLFLPISAPRPNRTWWFGCWWAEGGSVLTLGHAGHYVPICKPIGEVRLICANAALWCTITLRGEADAAQRSYCFFSTSFLPSLAQFLVSYSGSRKTGIETFQDCI